MKASRTSVDRLREIADELDAHKTAHQTTRRPHGYFVGYGGPLTLPDSTLYQAYLNGKPGGLAIEFFSPDRRDPRNLATIGRVVLSFRDSDVTFDAHRIGHTSDQPGDARPSIPDLARPLGDWLADGAQADLDRWGQKAAAGEENGAALRELLEYLGEDRPTEPATMEGGTLRLQKVIDAQGQLRAADQPIVRSPDLQDVDPLYEFVHRENGRSLYALGGSSASLIVAYDPGPLLAQ